MEDLLKVERNSRSPQRVVLMRDSVKGIGAGLSNSGISGIGDENTLATSLMSTTAMIEKR